MAFELIQLYATRETTRATPYGPIRRGTTSWRRPSRTRRLPDQAAAITAVKKDLESSQPMDRLVCRRRRIRQDGGRTAGRIQRGQRRPTGRRSRADDRPGAPALHDLSAATGGIPGPRGDALSPAQQSRTAGGDSGSSRRDRRHRDRHPPSGPERRPVQESRAWSSSTRSSASAFARRSSSSSYGPRSMC